MYEDVQTPSHLEFIQKFDRNIYFQGIFYIATGIGKTLISYKNALYHLSKYSKDNILWITYKKEIIDSQETEILGDKIIICNDSITVDDMNNLSGKILIILRQKLQNIYKKLNSNLIQGIIYDECHDASKVSIEKFKIVDDKICKKTEGVTYDILMYLQENNNLRYRVGNSATPLTSSISQNAGLLQLYGCPETNEINYLYTCSLMDGVNKKLILKPNIGYISLNDMNLLGDFNYENYSELENNVIKLINNVISQEKFIYKNLLYGFQV